MAEVVLDANVLVPHFDAADSLRARTLDLLDRLERDGHDLVLIDICVAEAVSVLCRRATERRAKQPPDIPAIIDGIEDSASNGDIRWLAGESARLHLGILDIVRSTGGALNFNDGLLVLLQREGVIDDVASFDADFDTVEGFHRVS